MTIIDYGPGWITCSECYPHCGMDRRQHTSIHQQWEHGVLIPVDTLRRHRPRLQTLARIDTYDNPVPLRRLAYKAAQVTRREGGWDFPSFPHPWPGDYRGLDLEGYAYLYIEDRRVIGYLVVYIEQRMRDWDQPHAIIGPPWVAAAHRRRGIGRQLFAAASADADRSGRPPAWLAPFTDVGKQFAEAVDPGHRIPLSWWPPTVPELSA